MHKSAAIYIRQSSNRPGDNTTSPEDQEANCRKLPAVAGCGPNVKVFTDLNKSGGDTTRTGYAAFLGYIRSGSASVVSFYDSSRIARHNMTSAEFYALMEAHPEIEVAMGDGSPFDRSPEGELSWANQASAATYFRKTMSRTRKKAHALKHDKGIQTGSAAYGYMYVGKVRAEGAMQPDLDTRPFLQRIFTEYASGASSTRKIAERLAAEKVPPSASSAAKGRWTPDVVAGMLANQVYIGRLSDGRPGKWEPIIEPALFQRVQDRLKAHAPNIKDDRKQRDYVFKGLLYCRHCGRRFTAQWSHGIVYYRCGSALTIEPCEMGKHALKETVLLPVIDQLMQDWFHGAALPGAGPKVSTETITQARAKIKGQLERNNELYVDGARDRAKFDAEKARLERLDAEYAEQATPLPDKDELMTISQQWEKGDVAQRWGVLSALFERIVVKEGGVIAGFKPRADRVGRVRTLIDTAIAWAHHTDMFTKSAEAVFEDGPGAATLTSSGSGEGGIRTLEGALHPLPA